MKDGSGGTISNFRVIGGRLISNILPSTLTEEQHAILKAFQWHKMLTEGRIPVKWLKPTKKGTKVNFSYAQTQEEMDAAVVKFEEYVASVNEKYGNCINLGAKAKEAVAQ